MPKYVLLYMGGTMPDTPEEGERVNAAWLSWMEAVGPHLVDGGSPLADNFAIGATAPSSGVNGYSIIEADTEAALRSLLVDHPHVASAGRVEVHEVASM
ncbi:hypothetical protein JF66_12440 [Cryobacterium sp. MLB-32]|uniref:hypothetical protein n=1 Tax=Cryobacterium sp. MLB-32 TaxID=1529318 RepID=UPI0004E672B1|nr:hypothetical protein [Cryobacterium sp. MLB-32]KFF59290.1 hypothetical protein JF66_12440 [Cryobacterium sp. MLB-32]